MPPNPLCTLQALDFARALERERENEHLSISFFLGFVWPPALGFCVVPAGGGGGGLVRLGFNFGSLFLEMSELDRFTNHSQSYWRNSLPPTLPISWMES